VQIKIHFAVQTVHPPGRLLGGSKSAMSHSTSFFSFAGPTLIVRISYLS